MPHDGHSKLLVKMLSCIFFSLTLNLKFLFHQNIVQHAANLMVCRL